MRYIYVDEAGTSASEPVTVVVGIIAQPDAHWNAVLSEIKAALKTVPVQYQGNFVFHAKSLWGDRRYRTGWPLEDRFQLITRFASIPVRFGLSIAVGKMRRDAGGQDTIEKYGLGLSLPQWHHSRAFSDCMVAADRYLRERTVNEIATVVVEDIPEMRQQLRLAFKATSNLYVPPHIVSTRPTKDELARGVKEQVPASGVERIKDGVHFAEKESAPLLQVADACAFSFRRFFSQQSRGDELVAAMGLSLEIEDWLGPESYTVFSNDPVLQHQPHRQDWS